jgi:hypothetical protein
MQDLLKEAIADAKAIRQVAIENAKASLAETFAPKIKRMVAEEMKSEEDDSLYEEDEYTDEDDSLDETLFEMEGEEKDDEMMEGEDMEDEMMEGEGMEDEYDGEDSDELDEILRELDMEDEDPMMEEDGMEEPEAAPAPKEAPVMKEPSKKSDLEEFIREMLSEMEGSEEEEEPSADMEAMKEELDSKEEELQEAYRTVRFLKKKINESLLINSKLLYSGKLFRAHNLDESQKVSILESFDRATSIRETKLLYASLATTLNEIKSKVNSKSMRLKESRASKSTLNSTKPSPRILEENKMVSRLQQLAGIIK